MRYWMLLLILALAGGVWGQGGMLLVGEAAAPPPPAQLLLDEYPGAAAAYSLRKLRAGYTGNCIQVRRSDTNALADIGFVNNYLDTVGLKAFCPVGVNCFVRTWYEQSGNALHVTMVTENSRQPQVVASGALLRQGGEVVVAFDGINDYLTRTGNFLSSTSAASMFVVTNFDNAIKGARDIIGGLSDNTGTRFDFLLLRQGIVSGVIDFYIEGEITSSPSQTGVTTTAERLYAAIYNNTVRRYIYANAVLLHNYTGETALNLGALDDATQFDLGTEIALSAYLDGNIKEFIIWPTDQDANRAAIQTAINSFYTTY